MSDGAKPARPFAYTCPICGGAMQNGEDERGPWFQCHTGHEFSAGDMDERMTAMVDRALSGALRVLDERALLCAQFADAATRAEEPGLQARWLDLQEEVEMKAQVVSGLIDRGWPAPAAG
ncbi:hypothetical protein VQH23_08455 [Pararoseomonas sp. SCSIO 73927]|uniref:hypothetical protein n=1 Tax=Pararoseomonas sp. SCSIO 73927 TaxID=3114537 RepID=UPI0030CF891A